MMTTQTSPPICRNEPDYYPAPFRTADAAMMAVYFVVAVCVLAGALWLTESSVHGQEAFFPVPRNCEAEAALALAKTKFSIQASAVRPAVPANGIVCSNCDCQASGQSCGCGPTGQTVSQPQAQGAITVIPGTYWIVAGIRYDSREAMLAALNGPPVAQRQFDVNSFYPQPLPASYSPRVVNFAPASTCPNGQCPNRRP